MENSAFPAVAVQHLASRLGNKVVHDLRIPTQTLRLEEADATSCGMASVWHGRSVDQVEHPREWGHRTRGGLGREGSCRARRAIRESLEGRQVWVPPCM